MSNTNELLKKYNLRLTKSLGQNFIRGGNIVGKIVDAANISEDDTVIEVGPGIGTLTKELAKRAGKVIAIEIDYKLIPPLTENLKGFSNIHIINNDILKLDLEKEIVLKYCIDRNGSQSGNIKVVANLPYYITTPIIMKFLEETPFADVLVFMTQKEVADRMTAKPGGKDYGVLSVAVQYYSRPEKLFDVSPSCFFPQPDVYSTVIRLIANKKPPVEIMDKQFFFKTVKAAFAQRRKTLLNSLFNSRRFTLSKQEIKEILTSIGIDPHKRGETLSIMQFAQLTNSFYTKDC